MENRLKLVQKPQFPIITHIDQALEAIKGREEFIIADKGDYIVIDYAVAFPDTFGCLLNASDEEVQQILMRRELRGIKFEKETGAVLARGFHKFFNLNERPETEMHRIDFTQNFSVPEKLDGSMIQGAVLKDRCTYMTMMGETDIANMAADFTKNHKDADYEGFCRFVFEQGYTPIFEYESNIPRFQIVVRHEKEDLKLTNIRHRVNGTYVSRKQMLEWADFYKVPVVPHWNLNGSIDEFLNIVREIKGKEGCIFLFESGFMLKIKAEDYLMRHRAKDMLTFEKDVLNIIFSGKNDDFAAALPDDEREIFQDYANKVQNNLDEYIHKFTKEIDEKFNSVDKDMKRFSLEVIPQYDSFEKAYAFAIVRGINPYEFLMNQLIKRTKTSTTIPEMRKYWGDIIWDEEIQKL